MRGRTVLAATGVGIGILVIAGGGIVGNPTAVVVGACALVIGTMHLLYVVLNGAE